MEKSDLYHWDLMIPHGQRIEGLKLSSLRLNEDPLSYTFFSTS